MLAALVYSLRRLGVPFIGTRSLGAVGIPFERQYFLSVGWRTGQSGAPPDIHCSLSGADLLPKLAQSTVASLRAVGTPDMSGAHRTVRCTPDSPVNYSRTSPVNSRERPVRPSQSGAPDTVRCTTGQSGAPRLSRVLAARAKTFPIGFFLFPALRHNTLVHKTMYLV